MILISSARIYYLRVILKVQAFLDTMPSWVVTSVPEECVGLFDPEDMAVGFSKTPVIFLTSRHVVTSQ